MFSQTLFAWRALVSTWARVSEPGCSTIDFQKASRPMPIGLTIPTPVITTSIGEFIDFDFAASGSIPWIQSEVFNSE